MKGYFFQNHMRKLVEKKGMDNFWTPAGPSFLPRVFAVRKDDPGLPLDGPADAKPSVISFAPEPFENLKW
jgi:hypothetical protein